MGDINIVELLSSPVFWLVLLVVLIVIEILTLGLTTIWFAGGALTALILSLFDVSLVVQIPVFFIVSFVLLFFTRPYAVKHLNRRTVRTNVQSLIGKSAVVTKSIDNIGGTGEISVSGNFWTARSETDDCVIKKDALVTVVRVEGVKAIVRVDGTLKKDACKKEADGTI